MNREALFSILKKVGKHAMHCPSQWNDIRTLSHCKWCGAGLCSGPNSFRDNPNPTVGLRTIFDANLLFTSRLKGKTETTTLDVCEALYADDVAICSQSRNSSTKQHSKTETATMVLSRISYAN